jgi:hypothetical protein
VTTKNDAVPNNTNIKTIAARWLGPCVAGQKPGVIFIDGFVTGVEQR